MDYFGLESLDALPDASDLFDLDSEEANQLFRDNHDLFEELEMRSKEHHEVRRRERVGFFVERLQKVMAHAGVASRRKCETFIQEGRVKVNGEVVRELGFKVGANDKIEVDSIPIYNEVTCVLHVYNQKACFQVPVTIKEEPL